MLNKDQSKPRGLISSLRITNGGMARQVSPLPVSPQLIRRKNYSKCTKNSQNKSTESGVAACALLI